MPVRDETIDGPVRHRLERRLDVAGPASRAQQRADDVVTVRAAQIGPERLAPPVREILVTLEVPEPGELTAAHRVAHPHRRIGIDGAERHVFGHAFDEPERYANQAAGHRSRPTPVMSYGNSCVNSWPIT